METKEGVKESGTPEPVKVDEKGVPLENRVREYARKLEASTKTQEELSREVEELRAFRQKVEAEKKPVVDEAALKQQRLAKFVEDPDAYIESKVQERQWQEKQKQAQEWLRSQPGYDPKKDDQEVVNIIFGIANADPVNRARAAYEAKENKRLADEFRKLQAEKNRENAVSQSSPDGVGRNQDLSTKPKREDLLKELRIAEAKGDNVKFYQVMSQLGDTR